MNITSIYTYVKALLLLLLLTAGACGAWGQTEITSLADITNAEGSYTLSSTFSTTGTARVGGTEEGAIIGTSTNPFKGTIDGQLVTITGTWDKPLFDYVEDATIKNVIIGNASVTGSACVGAIAGTAKGASRIYNCGILSGSVGSSGGATDNPKSANACGGLVGLLDGTSRVINCYSYATITGGNRVGGIVGYNNGTTTAGSINTMVMNCMFYGDITGGNKVSPVYGGDNINNLNNGKTDGSSGLNTFNYYAYDELKTKGITDGNFYGCALAVEKRFLTRFEFYRQLLNSNKKLAAIYITGNAADANLLAKWVLETADRSITNPKPYPVLKAQGTYPSIINYDAEHAPSSTAERNKGGITGTLSVTIRNSTSGGQTAPSGASISETITLNRTDKDEDRFNFNYDKVQLPFYNDYGSGNYTEGKVVTGWKIVDMTVGTGDDVATEGTFKAKDEWNGYNFADRKTYAKDLYGKSGRVFSQGAYFDVPYGVTGITIEPYWGNAAYIADPNYDVVCNTSYSRQDVSQLGSQVTNSTTFGGKSVKTSFNAALGTISSPGSTVYDNAIVLVGNFHQNVINNVEPFKSSNTPFTIMSVDADNDHEPDYSLIFHDNNRSRVNPIRFDFLNIIGTAQAQKPKGAATILNASVFNASSWFEITNTCLIYFSQFEYENSGKTSGKSPIILLGGVYDQFTSTKVNEVKNTTYLHVGGNAWFKEFSNGTHSDGSKKTKHIPISVTGGDYDGFYLTGTYNSNAAVNNDNAECYISGGHFIELAGAGQEQIDGNVQWQIYDADIDNFFGGGINDAKPILGTVTTDIFNSHVGVFCGGPKFGNMASGKAVTTNATGCIFDKYFGAGYGGNSINRKKYFDYTSYTWSTLQGYYTGDKGKYYDGNTTAANQIPGNTSNADYGKKGVGVANDFDYEFFVWTSGKPGVRLFVKFASFSLAQCNDVNSTLTGCTINGNFYGGGNLGNVTGKATSVLDGCTVLGNVFGGGYSATLPKIPVRTGGFTTNPNFNQYSGMFEPGVFSGTTDYEWKHVDNLPNNGTSGTVTEGGNNYIVTTVDLDALGQVANTELTIKGNTKVSGIVEGETTGGVFGGGDMSAVNGNTEVKIEATHSDGVTNVYGGGNTADVDGNTEVIVTGGKVSNNVFGGGKGATTQVGATATVNFGKESTETPGTYEGSGVVNGNIYGGSALGTVNTAVVNLYKGTMTPSTTTGTTGNVFGGGMGEYDGEHPDANNAVVTTKATVNQYGVTVPYGIYGGGNTHATVAETEVNLHSGTVGQAFESAPATLPDVVFGGGLGAQTSVTSTTKVELKSTTDPATTKIYGNVYGGSKNGSVAAVDVNLLGGTIWGNVFGGGYETAAGKTAATSVNVTLDGTKFDRTYDGTAQVFGANNLQGTPTGHVKVWVKKTVGIDKTSEEALAKTRDQRTTYDVAAVYGGGNQADYVPTDALLVTTEGEEGYDAGNAAKVAAACAEVVIDGCDLTSIEYVYGGGNAAAVPATDVTINGSYIIDYMFGGGNGKSTATFTNPGANVGIYNNGTANYGSGKAVTKLYGGKIHYVYGGSNTKGNVRGGTSMSMPESDGSCALDIKEIYGAGQNAEQDGGVTMILGCVTGLDNVYGGAKAANVKGGVDLVITSGTFEKVFGGNNESGTIQGPITLTIEETGCDPVNIGELYLGGNDAAYSVYGYYNAGSADSPDYRPRSSLSEHTETAVGTPASAYSETQWYANPVLNVVSCTSIGNVFGGGYGSGATMYGSPTVNINMIPGKYAAQIDRDGTSGADNNENAIGTIGNVYGGGNEGGVIGNPTVNICTESTNSVRTKMGAEMAETDRTPVDVLPAVITGDVFGAGKGKADDVKLAKVTGNTNIVMGDGSVAKSVYGGGELSQVTGNTTITVSGGSIGDSTGANAGGTYGNVYGGGKGNTTNVRAGLIQGNTNISVSGGSIYHNIYGGGAYGSVGTYTYDSDAAAATITGYTTLDGESNPLTGVARITITGGTIGIDGHENGMIFGSSRGDVGAPGSIHDKLAWVYDTHVIIGTEGSETGPAIKGSLYGSGENGHTYHDAAVTMYSGTVGNTTEYYSYRGNVYGGGCGTDKYDSDNNGSLDVYNAMAGIVNGNTTVNINGGSIANNIYGAGAMGKVGGSTSVTINTNGAVGVDGSHDDGNVYGAARGELGLSNDYASVTNSSVTVSNGTVKGSVYGGGKAGPVNGAVTVNLTGGTVNHDVYGGGALAQTNTAYSETYSDYKTNVTLNGTTIEGNLYGGGLGQQAADAVGELESEGYIPAKTAVAANVNGPVTVTVSGGQVTNVFGCNNLNGAPQVSAAVTVSGGTVTSNVYGGGNQADYGHSTAVTISGGQADNVFGGGLSAGVAGSVSVIISGGKVTNDVYGGGALANTNTANWDTEGSAVEYIDITNKLTVGTTSIAGYYTKSGADYTLKTNGIAADGTTYYKKSVVGSWKEGMNTESSGTIHKTSVVLTGGAIGNAYGGGLGNETTAANVYGDVIITVNKPEELTSTNGSGIGFSHKTDRVTYGEGDKRKEYIIPISGRVFGCNNINGTPTGSVRVEVYSTRQADEDGNVISNSEHSPNSTNDRYEIQGVYGGGNLSDYLPTDGKSTSVYVDGCDVTSIEKVYGGGNSASVPSSEVTINGSYDIGYAFGGGNGGDLVKKSDTWYENDGAIVIDLANIKPIGGKIGQVFGGSDAKGVCGRVNIDKSVTNSECPLILTRLYGAGNEADVNEVNIVISGCSGGENSEIKYVWGGSYNAHVAGDVNLTISAGIFNSIYGGNDRTGSIGGNITVNIEETDNCMPLKIQNLLGGGYQAAYPGTRRDGTEITTPGKITVNVKSATHIDNIYGGSYMADVNGDTEVNINMTKGWWAGKTYAEESIADAIGTIGNVYGGGNLGLVRGNSTVNIGTATTVGFVTEPVNLRPAPETPLTTNKTTGLYDVPVLGANITGDVFGGGNEGNVNGNTGVNICTVDYSSINGFEGVSIGGSIYGGGNKADVLKNTSVTMSGGYVFDGVYGGGLHGSVGTVTEREALPAGHPTHDGCLGGKPKTFKANTGKCTVVVDGGQVGPKEVALADGGMKNTARYFKDPTDPTDVGPVDVGFVFGAGRGEVENPATDKDADFHTFVKETYVTISGGLVMASVYGGGENGRVLNDTHVTISGGQIGCGEVTSGTPAPYSDGQFIDPTENEITAGNALAECPSWEFNKNTYKSYDPLAGLPYIDGTPVTDASTTATDGNTYYGSVFGGGSGYYPYEVKNMAGTVTGHEWLRSAGQVYGNTNITITGGHILTGVYGGNETTDVGTYEDNDDGFPIKHVSGGKSTITMSGGTVGVPRTTEQIELRPISCSLFGAGKGDNRTHFNTWTNVNDVEVNISGGIIYGSVFGGGEEGHVLRNVVVNISGTAKIGTHGTTSYEGNVFGGGRGFSGMALTAGSTGGNVTMNISENAKMLGSVYGGGRLASVGIGFTPPEDIYYGQLIDDIDENHDGNMELAELKHGHIAINISGGKIGKTTANETATHPVGGNVYGGSMGRTTYLNGERNPLWPKQAVAKESTITIIGGEIMNSVYGGSELGIVRNRATVNIRPNATPANSPVIHGNVFGGGYGSDDQDPSTISAGGYASIPTVYYTFTPMIWTGCVSGDTFVNISGGKVEKNVYGGGNFASVGLMNYNSSEDGKTYNYIKKHDTTNGFGLSWPYEFQYIQAAPTDDAPGGKAIGGKTTINITGGRIGTTISTDNAGFVYGGSKGQVSFKKADNTTPITDIDEQVYAEAFCANVRETEVTINYDSTPESDDGSTTPCIVRSVYGGGEDGHVLENAVVNLNRGWIGRTLFGGGKGTSTYKGTKYVYNGSSWTSTDNQDIHSWTAGKVYGNTTVTIEDGKVGWFVYGGGNMASVGKGNYSGGADDYSTTGYGETLTGNLWTSATDGDNAWQFLNSGIATVTIKGGTVGTATVGFNADGIPYGSVFGGSRGTTAIETNDVMSLSPLYKYLPDFYCGYVNKTVINVGGTTENGAVDGAGPTIYGSIYGGAQDGHVRNSTEVKMFKGSVAGQTDDTAGRSGHVFGAGSGIGKYTDPSDSKNKINSSSGSVTCTTLVELNGGSIAGNIYGGGAMASVGPPKIGDKNEQHAPSDGHKSISKTQVGVKGGSVGGSVYGASRGPGNAFYESQFSSIQTYDKTKFATDIWSDVSIAGGTISNNVYGGGEGGIVKESTTVSLTGGTITHDAYGGGQGTANIAADILGNTTVELNKYAAQQYEAGNNVKGCVVDKVFGCNDMNGTPKGHVTVHVYATQNKNTENTATKITPPPYSPKRNTSTSPEEKYSEYLRRILDVAYSNKEAGELISDKIVRDTITAVEEFYNAMLAKENSSGLTDDDKKAINNRANNVIKQIDKMFDYDVTAVYGGGDLAPYEPTSTTENTEVIIEGCAVTSIKQVYGGGNAASVPATDVLVKSCAIIDELFGGGNGKDSYQFTDDKWYENPGANVGYKNYTHHNTSAEGKDGSEEAKAYPAVEDATTPEAREAYKYGKGIAHTLVNGGHIHTVYGGSNMKGNISNGIEMQMLQAGTCTLVTDEAYASSKSAETDAESNLVLDCVEEGGTIYGGSYNANLNSDVNILITNGHYDKVFGGNNQAGTINGKITITIQEAGCTPITIGELYGGGYLAPYSIYGYKTETQNAKDANGNDLYDESNNLVKQRIPYMPGEAGALATPRWDPRINIVSATSIGKIFGGGYGAGATMIGSPHINVNMEKGMILEKYAKEKTGYSSLPEDQKDAAGNQILSIGTIGDIYGGGELADVIGNTYVEIGTGQWISSWDNNGNPVWETTNTSGEKLSYKIKTAAETYTQDECNTYNATLTGALSLTDVVYSFTSYADNSGNTQHGSGIVKQVSQAEGWTTVQVISNTTIDSNAPSFVGQQFKVNATTLDASTYYPLYTTEGTATGIYVKVTSSSPAAYNATLIGARNTNDIKTPAVWAWYDEHDNPAAAPTTTGRNAATITGNVFGGGKGETKDSGEGAFKCASAMVGADGAGLIDANGGTSVTIANGSVGGSVYGGGELGRVEKNTVVTIGLEGNTTNEVTIRGNVFGAGKGKATHGYAALVRGNSTVTIQGKSKVGGSVYGGGEIASVGRYNVDANGLPQSLANEKSGNCTVIVRDDAEIGPDDMTMFHVDNSGNIVANDKPDNTGHVFGAGMGATPYKDVVGNPYRIKPDNTKQEYTDENTYLSYIETLGLATQTDVTIGGNAFVKGDVFGGAEQGFVQHDTHLTIEGDCQIGNGYVQMDDDGTYLASPLSVNRRYTSDEWSQGKLIMGTDDRQALKDLVSTTYYTSSLPECASWKYGQATGTDQYAAHDAFYGTSGYDSKGGRKIADNGHTFYGNVFGGGSGYFPYKAGKWHWKAGNVGGNALVEIKGGHILTNVYGGNEMTNVDGMATVKMTGGTIGVPRTLGQIMKHPVTCYLFGGGAGDPRVLFNKQTNVQDAEVSVTGGWVYGSVFGGGEDGHVLRNVDLTIGSAAFEGTPAYADYYEGRATKIGTWGTSYVDGNIFGGGRGFAGDAYTAGNVAGSVTMTISGGEILGSVYGGGRLGSVGYGLYEATETDKYGTMRPDNYADDGTTAVANFKRGHVEIKISGGTIGNTNEFIVPQAVNIPNGLDADFTKWTTANWTTWKNHNNVPLTEYDTTNGRVTHTKGGNVFAGGMGRYYHLNGNDPITAIDWWKLGNVKSTNLTISGENTWIMGNVYGGGELGAVTPYTDSPTNPTKVEGGTTTISITGGTIGTEVTGTTPSKATVQVPENGNSNVLYTFGSVYGGGMGMEEHDANDRHGGEVGGNTTVNMSGTSAKVRASVFGGGEVAVVDGNTNVTISGGEIGRNEVRAANDANAGYVLFGGATMGNVYGGGKGLLQHTLTGLVKGNTNVTINAGTEGQPFIYQNVYGGGALASVGTFTTSSGTGAEVHVPAGVPLIWTDGTGTANVTINGGTIGISGRDNGMVYGSSRGDIEMPTGNPAADRYDKLAWVKDAVVTIGEATGNSAGPHIKGSVYGGGENGHNGGNATVTVNRGTIGIASNSNDPWATFIPAGMKEEDDGYDAYKAINEKAEITRGNVYGAGCGTDTYTDTSDGNKEKHNPWSGIVAGNTTVNIKGGYITQNVYGAGSMASVGTVTSSTIHRNIDNEGLSNEVVRGFALSWPYEFVYAPNTGKATVNITGGHLGVIQSDGTYTGGDVYGSARGEADNRYAMALLAKVKETEVNINYPTTADIANVDLTDETTQCITGSVHGSGENGFVYEDTHVTLDKGLIAHSLYGGGKGKGTYKKSIKILADGASGSHDQDVYGLLSGKVLGNTYVTMNDGHVMRNVYGGGNIASVGKGNYAGGADDYYPAGYGETLTGNLWDDVSDNSKAFLSSGKTTVKVLGGTVGYVDPTNPKNSIKNNLPYGNVIGGSAGESAPNIAEYPRYLYSPAFFSGYVNQTDVTIGKTSSDFTGATAATDYAAYVATGAPKILGSVYGGGQDGHVRRDTKVTVNNGEIGLAYDETNQSLLKATDVNNDQWLFRGNVYGGGSGVTKYKYDFDGDGKTTTNDGSITYGNSSVKEEDYSNSSGSVTRFTEVNILGGTIYRNVYGGGSMGSVGAPKIDQLYDPYKKGDTAEGHGVGKQSMNTVTIGGGAGKVTIGTQAGFTAGYGGSVFGAGRGETGLDEETFGTSIWTKVLIKDGANIKGNVFGGGDAGKVKKDTEVSIGEPNVVTEP